MKYLFLVLTFLLTGAVLRRLRTVSRRSADSDRLYELQQRRGNHGALPAADCLS